MDTQNIMKIKLLSQIFLLLSVSLFLCSCIIFQSDDPPEIHKAARNGNLEEVKKSLKMILLSLIVLTNGVALP